MREMKRTVRGSSAAALVGGGGDESVTSSVDSIRVSRSNLREVTPKELARRGSGGGNS